MKNYSQLQNRRKMLVEVLRYAVLVIFGAGGGFVFTNRRRLIREGKCLNDGICRGCVVFESCNLPCALSAKQVLERLKDGRDQKRD